MGVAEPPARWKEKSGRVASFFRAGGKPTPVFTVPRQAYSMGIKSIMQAKKILVIVSGESKANALKQALHGPITPALPASILQLHNDVTFVADEAAMSLLDV